MKNVLLISNQKINQNGVGNPIVLRMQRALKTNERVGNVQFLPFDNRIKTLFEIRKCAQMFDIVHIHFGGLYALIIYFFLFGLNVKTVITFHGTDIHAKALKTTKNILKRLKIILNQKASFISICLFDKCGFVSKEMIRYVPKFLVNRYDGKLFIQSLGVDYETFTPVSVFDAQNKLLLPKGHYALFSDVANTPIKRRDIAQAILDSLDGNFKMLIMCGVKPEDVPTYLNASDFVLLTSDEEGSPNIVREALSLNKRVYSVDVGDVKEQLRGLKNSMIISRKPSDAAQSIRISMKEPYVDNTRIKLQKILDFKCINENIIDLYEKI